jgi:hypothetical protein
MCKKIIIKKIFHKQIIFFFIKKLLEWFDYIILYKFKKKTKILMKYKINSTYKKKIKKYYVFSV